MNPWTIAVVAGFVAILAGAITRTPGLTVVGCCILAASLAGLVISA